MYKRLIKTPQPCFFTHNVFDSEGNFLKRFNSDRYPAIFIEGPQALYMLTRVPSQDIWITPAVIYAGAGGCTSPNIAWGAAMRTPMEALHYEGAPAWAKFVLCETPEDVAKYISEYVEERLK